MKTHTIKFRTLDAETCDPECRWNLMDSSGRHVQWCDLFHRPLAMVDGLCRRCSDCRVLEED